MDPGGASGRFPIFVIPDVDEAVAGGQARWSQGFCGCLWSGRREWALHCCLDAGVRFPVIDLLLFSLGWYLLMAGSEATMPAGHLCLLDNHPCPPEMWPCVCLCFVLPSLPSDSESRHF
jgi:hypothetical protein